MIPYILAILTTAFLVGFSKAVADITSDSELWCYSIFSVYKPTSFLGPKDKTWIRKDHPNKVINWLLHYPLVWVTDIWHFANAFNIISVIFTFIIFYYANGHVNPLILVACFYGMRQLVFNGFYHDILVKRKDEK